MELMTVSCTIDDKYGEESLWMVAWRKRYRSKSQVWELMIKPQPCKGA